MSSMGAHPYSLLQEPEGYSQQSPWSALSSGHCAVPTKQSARPGQVPKRKIQDTNHKMQIKNKEQNPSSRRRFELQTTLGFGYVGGWMLFGTTCNLYLGSCGTGGSPQACEVA